MKKKTIFILGVVLVIVLAIILFSVMQNQKKAESKEIVKESIENYLYNEKQYTKEDIVKVEIIYNGKMSDDADYYKYIVSVYYADEPDNEYMYCIEKSNHKADFISIGNEGDIKPSHEKLD